MHVRAADTTPPSAPPCHHRPMQTHDPFADGVAALERRQLAVAIDLLRQAHRAAPTRADVGAQLARALSLAQRLAESIDVADAVLVHAHDAQTLDTLGVVYSRANDHARAASAFERAAALAPRNAGIQFNLASARKFLGDFDGADAAYEACIRQDATVWKAHSALSQLRRQRSGSNHIGRLDALLETAGTDADARLHLHMALAKEHEDLGDHARAFAHYTAGKAARGATLRYDARRDAALFDAIRAAGDAFGRDAAGDPSHEPIFVIGMPRTGTTLVERILSSHPDVHAAGELQNFGVALKRLSGSRTPMLLDGDTLARTAAIDPGVLGAAYIASTRPATGHVPRFVDKLPQNFLYAGFIARALPHARIVCVRRHPLDTCLSNLRQLFALNSPYFDYAYDVLDIGRYYIGFERLMAHWDALLPGRITRVDYETLVDDQVEGTRALLAGCGLSWHDVCLQFERNPAPSATASAVQVRGPIHREARHRWRAYAEWLGPLRALLEEAGVEVPA